MNILTLFSVLVATAYSTPGTLSDDLDYMDMSLGCSLNFRQFFDFWRTPYTSLGDMKALIEDVYNHYRSEEKKRSFEDPISFIYQ